MFQDIDKRAKVWTCPLFISPFDATDFLVTNLDSPVDVIILNSMGGDVAAGLSINHVIREFCPDVHLFASAFVLSAANLIFSGVRASQRHITDGTMFLLHPISMHVGGRFPDIQAGTEMGTAVQDMVLSTLKQGGYPADLVERSCNEEVWFNSSYALSLNMARRLERQQNGNDNADGRRGRRPRV